MPVRERKAFQAATSAILLATLSVTAAFALVFYVLKQLALEAMHLHLHLLPEHAATTHAAKNEFENV
jgi:diadenosine tetraphosphate (Ap4A) HIT family hydrolase